VGALDTLNGMLFIFSLVSVPMFFTPLVIGIVKGYKKKIAFTIYLGYVTAILFSLVIGFDESTILLFIVYSFLFLGLYLDRKGSNLKKRMIAISALFLFFVGIGSFDYAPYGLITASGSEVNEQQINRDLRLQASKKVRIHRLEFWRNGEHSQVMIDSESPAAMIIMFDGSMKHVKDNFIERFEVQEAMRIFLYLQKRRLPFEIAGVHASVSQKWIAADLPQVLISKSEFIDIYGSLKNVEKQDEEDLVRRLSEAWIEKHSGRE
jgi:hypothetical protein